jgi:hypothetical protein
MPEEARTLGDTPVEEMAADVAPAGRDAPPAVPLAETVGVDAGVPLGMSEPYAARLPGGGAPAIIGAGVPWETAGAGGVAWPATGGPTAAGGRAEPCAEAGVTSAAAGGGVGAWGTGGGSGLAAPEERPLANPCDNSWTGLAGVGRPAGKVGAEGILAVLGMDGVVGIEGIEGGFKPLPAMPDMGEGVPIGEMIGVLPA